MPRWCAGTGFLARRALLEQEHGPEDQHGPGERQHALPEAERDQEDAQAEVEDAAGNSHSYPEGRVMVFPRPDQEPGKQGPRGRAIRCIHEFLLDTRCQPFRLPVSILAAHAPRIHRVTTRTRGTASTVKARG